MPIYMKYDGIDGTVTQQGHKKWIELQSCRLGGSRQVLQTTGATGEREAGAPNLKEVAVTKEHDDASGPLFKEFLSGEGFKKVKIDFVNTQNSVFMQIELEDVVISSFKTSGRGGRIGSGSGSKADSREGERPTEDLSLSYTKIVYVGSTQGPHGTSALNPARYGYSVSEAKPF